MEARALSDRGQLRCDHCDRVAAFRVIINILLVLASAVPYGLGWIAGKAAWFGSWFWRTLQWGWQDANKGRARIRSPKR
jgi:hypothetical protein